MQRSVEKNIIKTLLYSDIFDYPLSINEVVKFFISSKKSSINDIEKTLNNSSLIEKKNGFYFLKGRKKIVSLRLKRESVSREKLKKSLGIIKKIGLLPSVKLIGISGGLAMKNSDREDDVDLFVITKNNSSWATRAIIIFYLISVGKYRKRGDHNVSGKFCLNMIVEEKHMKLPLHRQNLYTAHEVIQMMPIFERENTYRDFLEINKWILKFMPNSFYFPKKPFYTGDNNFLNLGILKIIFLINPVFKIPQELLIKRHKTIEEVKNGFLAFHPFDYKEKVLQLYNDKLKEYGR